jgi:methyl-accepting chemotaxis protein
MSMNISTKIGGALLGLGAMVLVSGGAGYFAANQLSDGLDYVTTIAWDAADGAMEGTINLQGQIIVVHELLEETNPSTLRELEKELEDMKAGADESIERMIATGLFEKAQIDELAAARAGFAKARDNFIAAINKNRSLQSEASMQAAYEVGETC